MPESFPVPNYQFADTIADVEVARLLRQVEMSRSDYGEELRDSYMQDRRDMLAGEDVTFIDIGVRHRGAELVGFGSVAYDAYSGEICDFVVSPPHQHRGLGKAIIDERLRQADVARVASLYIPNLEPTNTLRSYYLQKGFVESAGGILIRA